MHSERRYIRLGEKGKKHEAGSMKHEIHNRPCRYAAQISDDNGCHSEPFVCHSESAGGGRRISRQAQGKLREESPTDSLRSFAYAQDDILHFHSNTAFHFLLLASCFLLLSSCSPCGRQEQVTRVVSPQQLILSAPAKPQQPPPPGPRIRVITVGPSKEKPGELPLIPPAASLSDALTGKLRENLQKSFKGEEIPEMSIYLSDMSLDDFIAYYEQRGYKVTRSALPASSLISSILPEHPELQERIGEYAGITINQVIIEGEDISASDKYIDPETFNVMNKTFITVAGKR